MEDKTEKDIAIAELVEEHQQRARYLRDDLSWHIRENIPDDFESLHGNAKRGWHHKNTFVLWTGFPEFWYWDSDARVYTYGFRNNPHGFSSFKWCGERVEYSKKMSGEFLLQAYPIRVLDMFLDDFDYIFDLFLEGIKESKLNKQ